MLTDALCSSAAAVSAEASGVRPQATPARANPPRPAAFAAVPPVSWPKKFRLPGGFEPLHFQETAIGKPRPITKPHRYRIFGQKWAFELIYLFFIVYN